MTGNSDNSDTHPLAILIKSEDKKSSTSVVTFTAVMDKNDKMTCLLLSWSSRKSRELPVISKLVITHLSHDAILLILQISASRAPANKRSRDYGVETRSKHVIRVSCSTAAMYFLIPKK